MLISLIDGKTRNQLVSARATAMKSGSLAGTALLTYDPALPDASRIAILMLRCEILYLDHQFDAACEVYDKEIDPLLERLSPECASLLADNHSTIVFASLNTDRSDQFYHQVDIRRLLGVELSDSSAQLEADRSAFSGKHYEALPTIWRLLLDAYRKQNWRALCWAHARMARECMALNWPDEAVWHAVQALDKDLVVEAARHLAASPDVRRITIGIDRLLMSSQLARHTCLAAEFLYTIADCIPDDRVIPVMEWVSARLDFVPTDWASASVFEPIWKLVGLLGCRITPDQALTLAQKAASHGSIFLKNPSRKHVVNALGRLFKTIVPESLDQFVDPILGLVTTDKSDFDFEECADLVCLLAEKSVSSRETLITALFPPGIEISNPTLLQVASILGWHPKDVDKFNEGAVKISNALRKQVEVLDANAEPAKIGGFGQIVKTTAAGKIIVHMSGAQHWIDAVAAHLDCLNDNSVLQLVQAILEKIEDDRNIVSNRISLIQSLGEFTNRLPTDLAEGASKIISRIAWGHFRESEVGQTYKEATDPLNPFKLNSGDPRDLRGIALLTLARGAKKHSAFSEDLHSGLLLNLLEKDDEKLRYFGVASARVADRLSDSEMTALVACGFDRSPEVRKLVLNGLASVVPANLNRQGLQLGVQVIRSSAESEHAVERAETAKAAKALLRHATIDEEMKERLAKIVKTLSGDISHYVRTCASDIEVDSFG